MKAMLSILLGVLVAAPSLAQPPIIDMHLHALPAGFAGPEPTAQCVSPVTLPASDQREPFAETWTRRLAQPPCDDPVWAPRTDEAIMRETIEAMNKLNVVGVASGSPKLVAKYVEAAPERIRARTGGAREGPTGPGGFDARLGA